jgi:hypothetical protein
MHYLSVTSYNILFIVLLLFCLLRNILRSKTQTNMASLVFSCFIIFLVSVTTVQSARQFHVGDHLGWRQPDQNNTAFYTQWAQKNRFQIGDSLGTYSTLFRSLITYHFFCLFMIHFCCCYLCSI